MTPIEKYIKEGGVNCPFCGSDEIDGEAVTIDVGTATQPIVCCQCDSEWEDHYTLSSIRLKTLKTPDSISAFESFGYEIEVSSAGCAVFFEDETVVFNENVRSTDAKERRKQFLANKEHALTQARNHWKLRYGGMECEN